MLVVTYHIAIVILIIPKKKKEKQLANRHVVDVMKIEKSALTLSFS